MTLRLAAFGLITSLFVGVIYVVTKPLIIEAKEEARIAQLYALAEPLLSNGTIQTPVSKELPSIAPTPLERPLVITPIADSSGQIGSVIPFRSTEGYSGTIQLLIALDPSMAFHIETYHRMTGQSIKMAVDLIASLGQPSPHEPL
jgi:electron transport complex protein RnfG